MPGRIPGSKKAMEKLGVPLVDRPADMTGKVDGVLVESQKGGVHWERARPFLEAGLPCFVDKPFTCSVADAKKIVALAAKKKVGVFSSSALRYAPELTASLKGRAAGVGHRASPPVGRPGGRHPVLLRRVCRAGPPREAGTNVLSV
jgi:hypothetical protein